MLFKSDAPVGAYLSKESPSQSKPLLLMLNGDYAAEMLEILGSGINAGEMEGPRPRVHHYRRAARELSLWSGLCHMDQPPARAAPGVEPVQKLAHNHSHSLGKWKTSEVSMNVLVSRLYSFYINNFGGKCVLPLKMIV